MSAAAGKSILQLLSSSPQSLQPLMLEVMTTRYYLSEVYATFEE